MKNFNNLIRGNCDFSNNERGWDQSTADCLSQRFFALKAGRALSSITLTKPAAQQNTKLTLSTF
jgi:hypothetical protein